MEWLLCGEATRVAATTAAAPTATAEDATTCATTATFLMRTPVMSDNFTRPLYLPPAPVGLHEPTLEATPLR